MDIFEIVISIIIFIQIIILIIGILYIIKYKEEVIKYKKMYDSALSKFNSKENIEDEFIDIYTRINSIEQISKDIKDKIESINIKSKEYIKQVEVLKYSAYDEKSTSSSFVLSFVNDNLNGVLVNKIHSNNGSNVYAKQIDNGVVKERVSKEEQEVLNKIKKN